MTSTRCFLGYHMDGRWVDEGDDRIVFGLQLRPIRFVTIIRIGRGNRKVIGGIGHFNELDT